MDFEFNENQLDLQKMVRELAEKEIGPRAKENDEKDVFPVDVFKMFPNHTADPKQQTSKE